MTENEKSAEQRQAYLDAIRARVCSVCLDQANDGSCGLKGRTCAIEAHLPSLVDALLAVDSPEMEPYVAAIKAQVCSHCPQQDPAGKCQLRVSADCALWVYLPLVLGAVEDVRSQAGA